MEDLCKFLAVFNISRLTIRVPKLSQQNSEQQVNKINSQQIKFAETTQFLRMYKAREDNFREGDYAKLTEGTSHKTNSMTQYWKE